MSYISAAVTWGWSTNEANGTIAMLESAGRRAVDNHCYNATELSKALRVSTARDLTV